MERLRDGEALVNTNTIPIDDTARDGRNQLVLCPGGAFALARWADGAWHMANGTLDFEPTHYRPRVSPSTTINPGGTNVTRSAERALESHSDQGRREPEQHGGPWPASRRRPNNAGAGQ